MHKCLIVLLFLGLSHSLFAQQAIVKGSVQDNSEHVNIDSAAVIILNERDSVLISFKRTSILGNFEIPHINPGKYILLVTKPKYSDYVQLFTVDTGREMIELGKIYLVSKIKILNEVVVKGGAALRFKGDTTEYRADSFKVHDNASVEDLLKQLPGIQVDQNGKITVRGKRVYKVLVDGDEFFGDDPTLVTRSLKASMIDKVQVYDKASDQAAFTKIDDGHKERTIDLKLKEEQKNGYFGKVAAGAGTNEFYENQAMFNYFKGKKKVAAYLIHSNTGKIGLEDKEIQSYSEEENNLSETGLDNWDGFYNGVGIPRVISGGLHFNNTWNHDRETFSGNYKAGHLGIEGIEATILQNTLPQNALISTTNRASANNSFRQTVNLSQVVKVDSFSTLKTTMNGYLLSKQTNDAYSSNTFQQQNATILNNGNRNIHSKSNDQHISGNILWQKRFRKEKRTFSINTNVRYSSADISGDLYAKNNFYNQSGVIDSISLIDQKKTAHQISTQFNVKAIFSEPISAVSFLVANYAINIDNRNADLLTFNSADGYKSADSLFSNHYKFNQFSNRWGLSYVLNKTKLRFQAGGDIGINVFKQHNIFDNTQLKRTFVNWFPAAEFNYQFSPYRTLSGAYNGNTVQPLLQQIQPIANNNDPLNVYIGNPNLRPQFANSVSINYADFKVRKQKTFSIDASYSLTSNPISTTAFVDSSGKSTYSFLNLRGQNNSTFYGGISYGQQMKFWNTGLGLTASFNGNQFANIVNNQLNISKSRSYNVNIILSKIKQNSYLFSLLIGPGYVVNKTSLRPDIDNNFWEYKTNFTMDVFIRKNFQFHTEINYLWQGKTEIFKTSLNRTICNVWIGKKCFRSKNLLLKISGNDIFNQNIGFIRSTYENTIYQNSYNTIARYFLLSAVFDFTKLFRSNSK